jgi:hypothetical protein
MEGSVTALELLASWTFRRRDDLLTIERRRSEDGSFQLLVEENGRPRSFLFNDFERLVLFQSDMESFLVRTGWSLASFAPDRRRGTDRRQFPRTNPDRRRWWTDVPPER